MAHTGLLCAQIEQVLRRGGDLNGNPLRDLQTEAGELIDLVRVVGEQAEGFGPQVPENLVCGKILLLSLSP